MPVPAVPPTDLLRLSVSDADGAVLIAAVGEIDSLTAPLLEASLAAQLTGGRTVTADLSAVTFLDSAGVRVLAVAHRRAADCGAHLKVRAATRAVLRPLQITGLTRVLHIEKVGTGH